VCCARQWGVSEPEAASKIAQSRGSWQRIIDRDTKFRETLGVIQETTPVVEICERIQALA
jgi:hypothetical protein